MSSPKIPITAPLLCGRSFILHIISVAQFRPFFPKPPFFALKNGHLRSFIATEGSWMDGLLVGLTDWLRRKNLHFKVVLWKVSLIVFLFGHCCNLWVHCWLTLLHPTLPTDYAMMSTKWSLIGLLPVFSPLSGKGRVSEGAYGDSFEF